MPQTVEARSLMAQHAIDLRARAERFRTFAAGGRTSMRQSLLDLAQASDDFAARLEAQLREASNGESQPSSAADPSVGGRRSS